MRKILIAGLMTIATSLIAQTGVVQNHCFLGGTKAVTSGLSSTNYLNGIIPSCTVTVYLTGTPTKATIYSDSIGTPLANPFTAHNATSVDPGGWLFYAATNAGLDVVMSGGISPNTYPTPVTLTNVFPSSGGGGGGGGSEDIAAVANIAALRTFIPTGSVTQVNVVGYYSASLTSAPDGGGGLFVDIGSGSAGDDDGGVVIYDSATGHDWKRMINNTETISTWFGIRAYDGVTHFDNSTQIQNLINYSCYNNGGLPYTAPFDRYLNRGKIRWQSGLIQFASTITDNCAPVWDGAGIQVEGRQGTNLQYTGASTPAFEFNGAGFSSSERRISNMRFTTDLLHTGIWTDLWQIDGTTHPAGGSFQFLAGMLDNVSFENATGAAIYYHVLPPTGAPIATFTGYISDGTGGSAGNILCVTSGTPAGPYWISGTSIPSYTYVVRSLDASTSAFPVTCTGPGGGTSWLLSNTTPLNISSESMTQGFALSPYQQADDWIHIRTAGVGQFVKTDPFNGAAQNNNLTITGYDNENGQTFSAGLAPVWADFSGFTEVQQRQGVYEGGAPASPYVYRVCAPGTFVFDGVHIENGTGGAPIHSVVDVPLGCNNLLIKLNDSFLSGTTSLDQGYVTLEPYTDTVRLIADSNSYPVSTLYTLVGNAHKPHIENTNNVPIWNSDALDTVYNCGYTRGGTTLDVQPVQFCVDRSGTILNAHGGWFDGLNAGIVSLSVDNTTINNEGIVTDSTEGRVFEFQSQSGKQVKFRIRFTQIPTELQGHQVTIGLRWKLITAQSPYEMCPMLIDTSGYGTAMTLANTDGNSGRNSCATGQYTNNAWHTSYFTGVIPSGATATGIVSDTQGSSPNPSGVQQLDIAAVYVSFGYQTPYNLAGGNPSQVFNWACSAAPTYGTYIVGDNCTNSTPTINSVLGFVATTGGAPGTWTAINNQITNSCGTTTTCANTRQAAARTVTGTVTLSTGTATVSSITAFTSSSSFVCTGVDQTAANAVQIVNVSSSSITITGTDSDVIAYSCAGN